MASTFWLDTRKITSTGIHKGKYHIKLCIDFFAIINGKKKRVQKRYKTNQFCALEDYQIMLDELTKTRRQDLLRIKQKLFELKSKADSILTKYQPNQKTFELHFLNEADELTQVKYVFNLIIQQKRNAKPKPKLGTAFAYETALNSILAFSHDELTFQEITVEWCVDYQQWFLTPNKDEKQNSLTSVGINMRHLRAVFNHAIKVLKIISPDVYPFGKGKYVIPEGGREVKIFLKEDLKNKFVNYQPQLERRAYYFDFALFDYYANGINFADILDMRIGQVHIDYIQLVRQKTESHTKGKMIIIPMHDKMREVIQKHGNKSLDPNEFVFPIYHKGMSPEKMQKEKHKFIKNVNVALEAIRKELKIPVKITTYTLRHTFSYIIMQLGASTEQLQDLLGHAKASTTENYKHGFSLEVKKKLSERL